MALGVFLVAAVGAPAGQKGYLVLLGPAPLRFTVRPLPRARVELPALTQPEPPLPAAAIESPTASTNQPALPATGQTNSTGTLPDQSLRSEGPGLPLPEPQFQGPSVAGELNTDAVTSYLLPGATNAPIGRLPYPSFVPPLPPGQARSSQATYESH